MATKTLTLQITIDSRKAEAALNKLEREVEQFGGTVERKATSKVQGLAGSLKALGAVGVATGLVRLAANFESSFAGIRKTVDATEAQFDALRRGMRALAQEIPVNVNELNRIGESAGQLGIAAPNILRFTRTVADLGVTTDLSTEMAATGLARLANITKLPQDQLDRLGSSIVALGNASATTESQILEFGLRLAGSGELAGLTEAQILAIGAAMSSVGVEAEAGGTAVQTVLLNMIEAVTQGGRQLDLLASTAGLSAEQFAAAFNEDAGVAFTLFVEGLGRQGRQAIGTLEALGLNNQRLTRSFLSVANAGDLLGRSMNLSTRAFAENSALSVEAAKRYETFASRVGILVGKAKDLGITIGEQLLPPINRMIEALKSADAQAAAKDFGVGLARVLEALGPPLKFLTEHFGAVVVLVKTLIGLKIISWLADLTTGSRLAGLAGLDVVGALRAIRAGYGKLVALEIGQLLGGWRLGFMGLSGAILAAGLALNELVKGWRDASAAAIAYEVDASRALGLALKLQRARVTGVVVAPEFLRSAQAMVKSLTSEIEHLQQQIAAIEEQASRAPTNSIGTGFESMFTENRTAPLRQALEDAQFRLKALLTELDRVKAAAEAAAGDPGGGGGGLGDLSEQAKEVARNLEEQIVQQKLLLSGLRRGTEGEQAAVAAIAARTAALKAGLQPGSEAAAGIELLARRLADLDQQIAQQRALNELRDELRVAALSASHLEQSLGGTEAAARESERHLAAFVRVIEAGVDPTSRLGKVMFALGVYIGNVGRQAELQREGLQAFSEFLESSVGARFEDPLASRAALFSDEQVEAAHRAFNEMVEITGEQLDAMAGAFDAWRRDNKDKVLAKAVEDWRQMAQSMAQIWGDAFGDMGRAVGGLLVGLTNVVARFKEIQAAGKGGGLKSAIRGADLGGSIGGITDTLFGGQYGGAFGSLGGAIAGAAGLGPGATLGLSAGLALIGSLIKKGADEGLASIRQGVDEAIVSITKSEHGLGQTVGKIGRTIVETIEQALSQVGADLERLPDIDIKLRDDVYSVFVNGIVGRFKSLDDAMAFAVAQALATADVSGAGDAVQAAMRNLRTATGVTLEQISRDLADAFTIDNLGLEPAALEVKRGLRSVTEEFNRLVDHARDWGLSLEQTTAIGANLGAGFAAARDAIIGRQRSEREIFEARAQMWNAERQAELARLQVERADLVSRIEMAKTRAALAQEETKLNGVIVRGMELTLEGMTGVARAAFDSIPELQGALAAVESAIESLANLDPITGKDFKDSERRRRKEGRQAIRDEVGGFGLDDLGQRLREAGGFLEDFTSRIEGLGFSVEETAALLAAATEEQASRVQAVVEDARRTAVGNLGLEVEGLRQSYADLGSALSYVRENSDRLGLSLADVGRFESELAEQSTASFADRLQQFVTDEETKRKLEEINYKFRVAQLRIEFELVKGLGLLGRRTIGFLQGVLDSIPDLPPQVDAAEQVSRSFDSAASSAARIADSFQRAKDNLADFLNRVRVGQYGGVSPVGSVTEARAQLDQIIARARTGDIEAIQSYGAFGDQLLRLAREAYASGPEFEQIRQYVLTTGQELLALRQGRQQNVIFDERLYRSGQDRLEEQRRMNVTLLRIANDVQTLKPKPLIVSGRVGG